MVSQVLFVGATDPDSILHKQSHEVVKSQGYDKKVSPSNATVYLSVRLEKIHSLNPGTNTFKATGWIRRYWVDQRLSLKGNPSTGSGIVDPAEIWTPDIALEEQVDDFQESCSTTHATVFGTDFVSEPQVAFNVFYSQACIFTVRCEMKLSDFPFDRNDCSMTWIPWVDYSYHLVGAPNATMHMLNTQLFHIEVNKVPSHPVMHYRLPPKYQWSFAAVRYELAFIRYSRYYVVNYILPLILNVILSWFTFFIPLGASDRIIFSVTLLLTGMTILFITSDKRPPEKTDGWIDEFQISSLLLISFPILQTICLHRVEDRHQHKGCKESHTEGRSKIRDLDRITRIVWPLVLLGWFLFLFSPLQPMWRDYRPAGYGNTLIMFIVLWSIICMFVCVCACLNLVRHGPTTLEAIGDALEKGIIDEDSATSSSENDSEDATG